MRTAYFMEPISGVKATRVDVVWTEFGMVLDLRVSVEGAGAEISIATDDVVIHLWVLFEEVRRAFSNSSIFRKRRLSISSQRLFKLAIAAFISVMSTDSFIFGWVISLRLFSSIYGNDTSDNQHNLFLSRRAFPSHESTTAVATIEEGKRLCLGFSFFFFVRKWEEGIEMLKYFLVYFGSSSMITGRRVHFALATPSV